LPPFFRLTSTFFGLTSDYKVPLLEEVYVCMQHLKGVNYSDVMAMPTYERRFYLGLLTRDTLKKQEKMEEMQEAAKSKNSKGSRTTRVSGDALKNKMKTGEIPTK